MGKYTILTPYNSSPPKVIIVLDDGDLYGIVGVTLKTDLTQDCLTSKHLRDAKHHQQTRKMLSRKRQITMVQSRKRHNYNSKRSGSFPRVLRTGYRLDAAACGNSFWPSLSTGTSGLSSEWTCTSWPTWSFDWSC